MRDGDDHPEWATTEEKASGIELVLLFLTAVVWLALVLVFLIAISIVSAVRRLSVEPTPQHQLKPPTGYGLRD